MSVVVIVEGAGKGTRFDLGERTSHKVGRGPECQVKLPDPSASKLHCVIEPDGASWQIRDMGGHNGTLMNGRRIKQEPIKPGDQIKVGQTTLMFESDDAVARADASTAAVKGRSGAGGRKTYRVSHTEEDSLVGHTLGDFRLIARIGAGGMGCVYKAIQISRGKTVAVKVLAEELTRDGAAMRRFVRSAKTALALIHPNMVRVYGAWHVKGSNFIVMEFVDGNSLDEVLGQAGMGQGLDPKKGLDIAIQVARALQHAHENGMVHRDVTPHNILVGRGRVAKLADVGLIKTLNDAGVQTDTTQSGVGMGTIDYMAPEQILDAKHVDCRADLYSLGVSLYHMLTGLVPFAGVTRSERINNILEGNLVPLGSVAPRIPEFLRQVVEKAIAKEPDQRYESAEEMLQALLQARRRLERKA